MRAFVVCFALILAWRAAQTTLVKVRAQEQEQLVRDPDPFDLSAPLRVCAVFSWSSKMTIQSDYTIEMSVQRDYTQLTLT